MKKYYAVGLILFKAQFAYRFDVVLTAFGTIWRLVFAWILWGAIFTARDEVGGFTLQAMLSYYVICSFLSTMEMSYGVLGEVSNRIKNGTFSKFMVIPSNPQLHFLSQTLGAGAYYALFAVIAAAAGTLALGIDLAVTGNPVKILLAIVIYFCGTVFMNSYQFLFGTLAFKFQDSTFAMHLLPNVMSFFSGELFPLSLLPGVFVSAIKYLPYPHIIYTPSMLLIDRMDIAEGLSGLAVLIVWVVVMAAASQSVYDRMRKNYEGVGI